MKNRKRIIAIVLAAILVCSGSANSVFAATTELASETNAMPIEGSLAEEITMQTEENANLEQEITEDETALENQEENISQVGTEDDIEQTGTEDDTVQTEENANLEQEKTENNILQVDAANNAVQAQNANSFFLFDEASNTITGYSQDPNAPKDIVIPSQINNVDVLHIGDNAFAGQQLTGVTLNDNLQTIGNSAFENNYMQNIVIPNGVTSIGSGAFRGCSSLATVNIPEGVTSIGDSTFQNCSNLTSVMIPESVTSIGRSAFLGCSSLATVNIPEGVTSIGSSAFSDCSFTSITIPEGVTSIGDSTFQNCSNLTSVTIPESVTSIGRQAFLGCSSLTTITIPGSVESIGEYTFSSCPNLKEIHIPKKEQGTISGAPWGAHNPVVYWKDTIKTDLFRYNTTTKTIEKYLGTDTTVDIPATIEHDGQSYPVEHIGDRAFQSCSTLTSVTIPEGVTSIGDYAFYNCSTLTSVTIPESVTSIGDYAFSNCSSLTSVTILGNVESIGRYTFFSCSNLKEIYIPKKEPGTVSGAPWGSNAAVYWKDVIKAEPFVYNTATKTIEKYLGTEATVDIPATIEHDGQSYPVEHIGDSAFQSCSTLTSVTIPDSVMSIGRNAFYNCRNLTSVTIPESVTRIEDETFYFCNSLSTVTILGNVDSIGNNAFSGCPNLREIHIPKKEPGTISGAPWGSYNAVVYWKGTIKTDLFIYNTESKTIEKYLGTDTTVDIPATIEHDGQSYPVEHIGDSAFSNCSSLTSVTIPQGVTSIGSSAFYNCSSLTSVTISEGVTSIGNSAFYNCSSLTSVTIPEGVTSIGNSAFSNCSSLTSVTISEGVTSIGNSAFYNCSSLTSVTIPESVTSIRNEAFRNCSSLSAVTILGNVESIEARAFDRCFNLGEIHIPAKLKNSISGAPWSSNAVVYWKDVIKAEPFVYNTTTKTIEKYIGTEATVDIPATIEHNGQSYPVEHIGSSAFYNCSSLTSVTIPEGVTSIEGGAFSSCSSLTSVTIPEGVTSIGYSAFSGCSSLTSVTIPESVADIGNSAFSGCSSLTSVTIPDRVRYIGIQTFARCNNLRRVEIGNGIQRIDSTSFSQCPNLEIITVMIPRNTAPSSLTDIQPWGAPQTTKVYYADALVSFEHTVTPVTGEYARDINISASINGAISTVTLPNGTVIHVGTNLWPQFGTYKYTVTSNGEYIFKGMAASGVEIEHKVIIDGIGKPTVTAKNATIFVHEAATITEEQLLQLVSAKATTVEKGEDFTGGTIELASGEMEKIRALTSHKQTATITINATSPTGLTSEVSVEIKALQVRNLTFDVDGDTAAVQPQQIIVDELASQPQPLTKVGYTLSDWYKEADFQNIWNFYVDIMPDQDITLYATWQAHKYKVVFDANGGTGAMTDQAFVYDTAQALTTNTITREGYTFEGWSTSPNGQVVYTDGETVQNLTADDNGIVTLYAVWRAHTYNVVFDANGGTGAMTNQAFVYDIAQELTANTFTKVGYTLAGWSTTPDGLVAYTDRQFVQNLTADDNGIVTLYAVWQANPYKVVFDANGGTGAMEQAFVYDTAQALTTNTITREGYTFQGWSTTPNGSVEYTDGETVQNLTADNNGIVTLYAVWQVHTYNVVFDANSGTGTMTDMAFVYDEPQVLTANTFTKEGYTFAGWSTTPDGQVAYTDRAFVQNLTADDNGVVTLYAVWQANPYKVVFDANGGTGAMEQAFVYDTAQALTTNTITREGYTFQGWSTTPNGLVEYTDGETVQNLTADDNGIVTLYAVWQVHTYNVVFDANSGTGTMTDMAFVYDEPQALTANTFTREGYTFKGWSTTPNGLVEYTDGETVQNLTTDDNGIVTLYAVWEANAHHIEFHANGGTGTMANQVFVYDVSQALTANAFMREGYTFLGWSTTPNGQVVYADGEVIQNLTADHNTVITIYGAWEANTYNVAFNANGGTGDMSNQAFVYDAAAQVLTANAFTREGYTFKGWSTSPNGQVVYTDGETVQNLTANANGVVTLYAVWEANVLSGSIQTGDGTMQIGIGASILAALSAGVMFITRRKKNQDNA